MANDQDNKPVLSQIDPEKRQFIGKLIRTTAFAAPLIASFAMDSINTSAVASISSNILG
ncbi:MAG TPA: hypothetical protein VFA91_01280 [Candidatus Polarisedimenticolia bacterium]|jgi:hypothetical protein|nr:hypothetical protein [Candidatus Polarisedimenticolia bacterium]